MSEENDLSTPSTVKPQVNSLMDEIRQRHQKLTDAQDTLVDLPGYEGVLVARYKAMDFKEDLGKISALVERQFKDPADQALHGGMLTIARACIEDVAGAERDACPHSLRYAACRGDGVDGRRRNRWCLRCSLEGLRWSFTDDPLACRLAQPVVHRRLEAGELHVHGGELAVEGEADPAELAAKVAVAGFDPIWFLRCDDPVEAMTAIATTDAYFKLRESLDRQLAVFIVNTLAKSMKGSSRGASGAY
jgi:hypothetical protein